MFENLNAIEWGKLSHSHGAADEVPLRLAALLGSSDDEREAALEYFWEFMLHQGSRYEASPYVVPFLFEVLTEAEVPLQHELIDLLLGLAIGYGESFLPDGYDLKAEERRFEQQSLSGLFDFEDARSAYYEVQKRADAFIELLRPEFHPDSRLSAAFAVAHFAQHLSGYHSDVARYIASESDEIQLQSLILCFGMLGRYAENEPDIIVLNDFFETDCSQTLQVCASIALTTIRGSQTDDRALKILFSALAESWKLETPRESWLWWNEGDLLGYAGLVLRLVGADRRDEIAFALCQALEKTDACTFAVPQTLLEILFPDPKPHHGWNVAEFDDVQRTGLKTLLRTRHWRDWMISSKFLPPGLIGDDYRDALQMFVRDVTGSQTGPDFNAIGGNVSSWDLEKHWP